MRERNLRPVKAFSNPALRLGFGCSAPWGAKWFSEKKAAAIVEQALVGGVAHFDTGAFYCGGEAERRLGRILKSCKGEPVFVSTKTGTRFNHLGRWSKDFSPEGIRRDVEESLKRLGLERLDLLYLHGPNAAQIGETRETMARLKEEGLIALDGVCGRGEALDAAIEAGADAVMGVYNLFERDHGPVFSRARIRGVRVAAIAPLARALYAREVYWPRGLPDLWKLARAMTKKRAALSETRMAREALDSVEGWNPAQLALGFALANADIDVAVTTTTKPAHLDRSMAAAARALDGSVLARLAALDAGAPGA